MNLLTGQFREPASRGFIPVSVGARAAGRSVRTVRTWISEGSVRTECHTVLLVFWPDLMTLTHERARRVRVRHVDRAA